MKGTLPAGLKAVVEAVLKPEIGWRELLAQFVTSCYGGTLAAPRAAPRARGALPAEHALRAPARHGRHRHEHPELEPNLLIYFTDGYGDCSDRAPAYPVMWLLTKDGHELPWGWNVKFQKDN